MNETGRKCGRCYVPKSSAEDTAGIKVDDKDRGTGFRPEELAVTHGLQCSIPAIT